MTKSALVKIGVKPEEAESIRSNRQIRQILEQEDAAIARVRAASMQRIRAVIEAQSHDAPPAIPFAPASGE